MRVLYDPGKILKRVVDPLQLFFKDSPPAAAPAGPSAADLRAQETAAREEAARRAASDAQNRQGAATSILTDPNLAGTFGATQTGKKSLFGG